MNNISNCTNSANIGATEMKFNSPDGGGDDKHSGGGLVEISKIFATRREFLDGTTPLTEYSIW